MHCIGFSGTDIIKVPNFLKVTAKQGITIILFILLTFSKLDTNISNFSDNAFIFYKANNQGILLNTIKFCRLQFKVDKTSTNSKNCENENYINKKPTLRSP